MRFCDRLKSLRKEKNMTQVSLATKMNMTERQYQRLEAGDSLPMHDNLIALADLFDVSLDYLVGRSDVKERR